MRCAARIWGVNTDDVVYYNGGNGGNLTEVQGTKLKQVSVSGNMVWGINSDDKVYQREGAGGEWIQLTAGNETLRLKQLAVSGNMLWGVDSNDDIYHRQGFGGNVIQVPGKMKQVTVTGNTIWGTNPNPNTGHGQWQHHLGRELGRQKLVYGGLLVCGGLRCQHQQVDRSLHIHQHQLEQVYTHISCHRLPGCCHH